MEDLYTLVTIYTPHTGGNRGKQIIHSYGPYTRNQARYRQRWYQQAIADGNFDQGDLKVVVTKVADPEQESLFVWAKK